ncbi:hypothetical protein ACFRJ6_24795, partial [Aneurinibacillus aneurinilyticus]
ERVSQDPEVLLAYEARRKALLDEKSALRRAEKQGEIIGEERGKRIGEEIGKKIGEKKAIMKVALSMIQKGLDNETVAELTELTQEEIEQLRRQ